MVKVSNKIRKYYKNPRGVLVLKFKVKPNCQIYGKGAKQETKVFKPPRDRRKDKRMDYTVYMSTGVPTY